MFFLPQSINDKKSLILLGLATLGLLLAPNSASAFELVNKTGFKDSDFENLRQQGQFTELFVAEGRIGDNNPSEGIHEIDILRDTKISFTPVVKDGRTWQNNSFVDFSLEYTGSEVTYKVGEKTLKTNSFSGPVTDIFLRTFAQQDKISKNNKNNAVQLTDLLFYESANSQGKAIGNLSSFGTATSSDTDYIQLSKISAGFKLTGKVAMSWEGGMLSQSNLAYQIKVGNSPKTTSVPEPGTLGAIALAAFAGIGYKRRKSS